MHLKLLPPTGRRALVCLPAALLIFATSFSTSSGSLRSTLSSSSLRRSTPKVPKMSLKAPIAKKVNHVMEMFGDDRSDDYYWLRDDSRSSQDVLSYLNEENEYTESVMAETKAFENMLMAEIRGRIKEDDITAPVRKGPYYYYTRNLQGKEYCQHCRRAVSNASSIPSVHDSMPEGPNDPPEHIILDENINAQSHQFYMIDAFKVSPNHKMVAYAEDTKGDEIYTLHVIDADSRAFIGTSLTSVTSNVEWAGNEALVYVTMDETLRPDKVWLHKLGTNQSTDSCLYHEKDDTFSVDVKLSDDEKFLFIASSSKTTRFIFYLGTDAPHSGLKVLTPRVNGVDTFANHRGGHFFIMRRSTDYFNSELLACPVDDVSATTVLIPHRESIKIQDVQLFSDNIAVFERENGLPQITAYSLPSVGMPITSLTKGRAVEFVDPVYAVDSLESDFQNNILRFQYSSLRMPTSVYHYDMTSGASALKKTETVLGKFNASNYITERKWSTASDGTKIPISIVYRKDQVKLDGSDPLLLYGYGSYEICIDPAFKAARLSLLDRGFIYAIAHIRGGGEMGRPWYENGKLMKKKNTFTDFICCAEYLLQLKYSSKEKLCIEGRSAGGLLIGSVLNMRPDLFKTAVAGVPFVDVLTTMLDPSIPLTTAEWEEWGDPRKEEFYWYMKSYSPVDNVEPKNYPNILVTAGLNDPRVMYSEPAKLVAKLRELKTDANMLLFKCEMGSGHFSKSGRFERLQEDAFKYSFLMKTLNMIPANGSGQV